MPEEIIVGGHYKIIKELGEGGFGVTSLAEDTHQPKKRLCVVKKLAPQNPDLNLLEIAKRRFRQEAEILEKLGCDHSQIPRLYAFFAEQEEFYLVQEFIKGHTLTQELNKQWSESEVVELLQDICSVLEFVHQNKCIHRDIKPDNLIRRDEDGKIVLIDFGAVKEAISQSTIISKKTIVIGTPDYMPTEQLDGRPRKGSDIYALGITAIQLMSGLTALEVNSQLEERNKISIRRQFLRDNLPQVSPQLVGILEKMTRSQCSDRYQNVEEILEDLNNLDSPEETLLKLPKNKFKWLLGGSLLLLLCVAGWAVGKLLFEGKNSVESLCPARFNTRVSWGNKYLSYSGENLSESVNESIDKASKNLKSACEAFGDTPEEINTSIEKFKVAIDHWQEAQRLAPENQQIITYLQNSQLLLRHAENASKDPQSYNLRPIHLGFTTPIDFINPQQNPGEMRDFGYQQNIAINYFQYVFNQNYNQGSLTLIIDDQNDDTDGNRNVMKPIVKELKDKLPNITVVGHTLSSISKVVIPFYDENKIVVISATSTSDNINPNNSPYFRRVVPSNKHIGKAIVHYLNSNLELNQQNKILILYQGDDTYAEDLSQYIYGKLPQPDKIKRVTISDNDLRNREEIRGTDVVILIPNGSNREDIISSVVAATEEGAIVIGPDSMLNRATIDQINNQCYTEGLFVVSPYVDKGFSQQVLEYSPSSQIFLQDWRLAHSHAAAEVAKSMQQTMTDHKVNPILLDGPFDTVIGPVDFVENGNRRISGSEIEDAINVFQVTPECEFRKLD